MESFTLYKKLLALLPQVCIINCCGCHRSCEDTAAAQYAALALSCRQSTVIDDTRNSIFRMPAHPGHMLTPLLPAHSCDHPTPQWFAQPVADAKCCPSLVAVHGPSSMSKDII
jgi:hypothetical protein